MEFRRYKRTDQTKEIPRAAQRANPDWRCPVCGAPPSELLECDELEIEAVRCSICMFTFSLSTKGTIKGVKRPPVNALNDDWLRAWKIIFPGTNRNGEMTLRVMESVDDPRTLIELREHSMKSWKEDDPNWNAIKS